MFAARAGLDAGDLPARIRAEYGQAQEDAKHLGARVALAQLPDYWSGYAGGCHDASYEVDTGVPLEELRTIAAGLTTWPADFAVHPKVAKLLEQRAEMAAGSRRLDYGMAEALAFGSLLRQGMPIRLSGQDSERGTFNQRHAVLIDTETERKYMPLAQVGAGLARCGIDNSPLSEAAVLGFEYGYSRDYPEALVLWEAQFGDFANSAQVIIDQFLSAGEDKWSLLSGLVLLLPHGYEGQGPEHSSARIERFLQLAGEDNLQVCQPSTAAQYFHLLRRQALRRWRKPLVVFTPKSMLRHAGSSSAIEELTAGRFQTVRLDDEALPGARRIVIGTGKIVNELRAERKKRGDATDGDPGPRAALPVPPDAAHAGDQGVHGRARAGVGAGGAEEHGRALLRDAAAPDDLRLGCDVGEAARVGEPGHRLGQGAPDGAAGAARAGVRVLGRRRTLSPRGTASHWQARNRGTHPGSADDAASPRVLQSRRPAPGPRGRRPRSGRRARGSRRSRRPAGPGVRRRAGSSPTRATTGRSRRPEDPTNP